MDKNRVLIFVKAIKLFSGGSRYRRDAGDDIAAGANQALEDTESFFKTIYGARCVQDDQCFAAPYISYCNKEAGAAASITGISGQ